MGSIGHCSRSPSAVGPSFMDGRASRHAFKLNPNSISVCPARDIGAVLFCGLLEPLVAWPNLPCVRYRTATKSRFDTLFGG
jgi:hypothetical protein